MPLSAAVDSFSLSYDRSGSGRAVVLLHGWPGLRSDQELVAEALSADCDVVVPDLRGFGESFDHGPSPQDAGAAAFGAEAQAASVLGLIDELGLERPILSGYDVGSRVAQAVAAARPDAVGGLVLCPPLPGAGERVLAPEVLLEEFWYQQFHRLGVSADLMDGDPRAVRAYLGHIWSHWAGPGWQPDARFDAVVEAYARPGAFTASVCWYRAGAGTAERAKSERAPAPEDRLAVATKVLWPACDPLFPQAWSDRLDAFFSDVELSFVDGVGHFVPLEAPAALADAIRFAAGLT